MSRLVRALSLVTLLGGTAFAEESQPAAAAPKPTVTAPSADAVKNVWEYFNKGQGQGPVLADWKVCLDVHKKGESAFECTEEIPAEGVKAGTMVMLWQAYIVPQGDKYEDLAIQVKHNDVIRETKDVKVEGKTWRSRTWNGVRLSKPGKWNLVIMKGEQVLKSIPVNVTES